jgi:predicted TIM-barrel fold metal-dependent hydrolase
MGMADAQAVVSTSFGLDDIKHYKNMARPAVKALFEEYDGVIFGEQLWRTAEVLTGIQRRVDLCREGINQDVRSFAVYFRLVHGDPDAVKGSVLADPLDVAVRNHGGPAAFNTTEDELRSFKKASKEYVSAVPRDSADKIAGAIERRMIEQDALRQEIDKRLVAEVPGSKFEN